MPRPRQLPLDDALLDRDDSSSLIKVSPNRWDAYYRRFPALMRARRVVQVNEQGRGVFRWLRSGLIEHIHLELANDRPPVPPKNPPAPGGPS